MIMALRVFFLFFLLKKKRKKERFWKLRKLLVGNMEKKKKV